MTALPLDANDMSWLRAALLWTVQGNDKAADKCIAELDQAQTLAAWHAVNRLQARLTARHADLVEAAILDVELAAILAAPPSRAATVCAWCGDPDCTERFAHDRLNSRRETTWRERAKS